jgi:hypothetical protein
VWHIKHKNLLGRTMRNAISEEEQQRVELIKKNLIELSSATAEQIIAAIETFLAFLQKPNNSAILNHRYLYPYFSALIKSHGAILKGLNLINTELVFQGATTPLMQLIGIYELALFAKVKDVQSLADCLRVYSSAAKKGNLEGATALIQYYLREIPKMSTDNFESFLEMINTSVFSDPTVLQASGFFLAAQLYYQISQRYLEKEKIDFADKPDALKSSNAFEYFEKSILHYMTAIHLLKAGQECMPLVGNEKLYPQSKDEEKIVSYIGEKVNLFKEQSEVLLDCTAVDRGAYLKAKQCAQTHDIYTKSAAKPLQAESLGEIIQKILNELKPANLTAYGGAYFSPASNPAHTGGTSVSGPKP